MQPEGETKGILLADDFVVLDQPTAYLQSLLITSAPTSAPLL